MYSILGLILLFHLGAVILPGPDFAITLRYSLIGGRRSGILCACGVACGVMINAMISFLIGQTLHERFPFLYKIFILVGLAYLLYLGIILIKNYFKPQTNNVQKTEDKQETLVKTPFITGLFTNVSNVKAIVFFNSILPLVNHLNTPLKLTAWICIGTVTAIWFSLVASLLSQTRIRNIFLDKMHIIEVFVGGILILFSITIFFTSII